MSEESSVMPTLKSPEMIENNSKELIADEIFELKNNLGMYALEKAQISCAGRI
jgi:hypothetical protein